MPNSPEIQEEPWHVHVCVCVCVCVCLCPCLSNFLWEQWKRKTEGDWRSWPWVCMPPRPMLGKMSSEWNCKERGRDKKRRERKERGRVACKCSFTHHHWWCQQCSRPTSVLSIATLFDLSSARIRVTNTPDLNSSYTHTVTGTVTMLQTINIQEITFQSNCSHRQINIGSYSAKTHFFCGTQKMIFQRKYELFGSTLWSQKCQASKSKHWSTHAHKTIKYGDINFKHQWTTNNWCIRSLDTIFDVIFQIIL